MTAAAKKTPAPPTPRAIARRLTTLRGVRRELAAVYADARCGIVQPGAAAKLAFVLSSIRAAIEADTFEQRLAALEARDGLDAQR